MEKLGVAPGDQLAVIRLQPVLERFRVETDWRKRGRHVRWALTTGLSEAECAHLFQVAPADLRAYLCAADLPADLYGYCAAVLVSADLHYALRAGPAAVQDVAVRHGYVPTKAVPPRTGRPARHSQNFDDISVMEAARVVMATRGLNYGQAAECLGVPYRMLTRAVLLAALPPAVVAAARVARVPSQLLLRVVEVPEPSALLAIQEYADGVPLAVIAAQLRLRDPQVPVEARRCVLAAGDEEWFQQVLKLAERLDAELAQDADLFPATTMLSVGLRWYAETAMAGGLPDIEDLDIWEDRLREMYDERTGRSA